MHSREQLEILEEDGLLIIPLNRGRLALRSLVAVLLVIAGLGLWSASAVGLESLAHIFLRPPLWLGAGLLAAGVVLLWRTRAIRGSGLQLILTDESLVLEHRPGGTWTTLHRLRWDEIIAFAAASGPVPGASGRVVYTLRPSAARRIDGLQAAEPTTQRRTWARLATEIDAGRGAIPGVIGGGPAAQLEMLRAAHRRYS